MVPSASLLGMLSENHGRGNPGTGLLFEKGGGGGRRGKGGGLAESEYRTPQGFAEPAQKTSQQVSTEGG